MLARLSHTGDLVDFDVPRRELAAVDRQVVEHIGTLDILLGNWAGRPHKEWPLLDGYLDERLFRRSPDAMATGPIVPGRSS